MEPTTEQAYQRRIAELQAENAELKALVAELKAQVALLSEQVAKLAKNSSNVTVHGVANGVPSPVGTARE